MFDQAVSFFTKCWNAGYQFNKDDMGEAIKDYEEAVKFIRENYNETNFLKD